MEENKTAVEAKAPATANDRLRNLIAVLKKLQAEVASADRPQFITNGQFRFAANSMQYVTDIMTERNENKLVEILAFLKDRERSFSEAAEELGVKAEFTWLTASVEDWKHDLKTRIGVLHILDRKAELIAFEKKINEIMTPELRAQLELDAMELALGI